MCHFVNISLAIQVANMMGARIANACKNSALFSQLPLAHQCTSIDKLYLIFYFFVTSHFYTMNNTTVMDSCKICY